MWAGTSTGPAGFTGSLSRVPCLFSAGERLNLLSAKVMAMALIHLASACLPPPSAHTRTEITTGSPSEHEEEDPCLHKRGAGSPEATCHPDSDSQQEEGAQRG